MDLAHKKDVYVKTLEERLTALLKNKNYPPVIYDAISYSLLGGGKRMRPVLLLAACEAVADDDESGISPELSETLRFNCALDFACAIEMIHTYSLIHDDLPAIDNDDTRRGRPTNHKVFGEAMAILAGDALLNMSYELMIDACIRHQYLNCLPALVEIARSAGINGMIGGQVMDVHTEGTTVDEETLLYIHEHKTAALIKASIVAGAIIGGAGGRYLKTFRQAANHMGLAFQIKDDILDVTGDSSTLGKPVGSDARNNKNTYVSVFGLEQARRDYQYMWDSCIQHFNELGAEFLAAYAKDLRDRVR
ncbi:MAG: polyprenyl synthetase family protein [Defluviitaleaceae bacterium]|nr:polyprenyl synthetase family protein [Defluviitaleaceae bacterium]